MKKVVFGIVLILVAFGFFSHKKNINHIPQVFTVEITDNGFVPSRLLISQGDKVIWVNRGEKKHWPASNNHPTHTLYPEGGGCLGSKFDACKGLAKGEDYSFKFDVIGVWPVHDHLFPGLVMTIEVIKDAESVKKQAFEFKEKTPVEDFRKFDYGDQAEFIKILSESNPEKAWAYLKKAFVVKGEVIGNAHEFAHIIGNESYKKSGIKGIKICDNEFAFGCFHGVTEEMLLTEGPSKIKEIEIGCLKAFPPEKTQGYTGCIHGTGHGVYTWEDGDLKKALLDCDMISPAYRQYCYDGVFMENSTSNVKITFDPKDPWKLCTDLPTIYHRNCARYQSQIFFNFTPINKEKNVGLLCSIGSTKILEETCFLSLGFHVAQSSLGDVQKIQEKCDLMPSQKGREICIMGAATESTFQKYEGFNTTSKKLCGSLETAESRQECFRSVEAGARNLK